MDLDLDIKTELNEIKQEEEDIDDTNINLKMEPDSGFDSSFTGDSQKAGENSSDDAKDDPQSTNKPAKRVPDGIQQGVKKIKYEEEM
ncbi:unnamed protein product [Callosobruchus maculatus]|uniref:Uncharacterized protein n=1 Tax=Callosobruchus maculatus TaxID=64391 RepID=A0A653DGS0_CALMS|nr:unnamed protein product [Callosobruchus maculatus]